LIKQCSSPSFFFSVALPLIRENYRTQTEYDDSLISKVFLFQFVNSYTPLFYIAFFKRFNINPVREIEAYQQQQQSLKAHHDQQLGNVSEPECLLNKHTGHSDCLFELETQLGGIFVSLIVIKQLTSNFLPWIRSKVSPPEHHHRHHHYHRRQRLWEPFSCCLGGGGKGGGRYGDGCREEEGAAAGMGASRFEALWQEELGTPLRASGATRSSRAMSDYSTYSTYSAYTDGVSSEFEDGRDESDRITWQLEHQMNLAVPPSNVDDFMALVIQVGYVTLFAAAFPLAPLFAVLTNVFQISTDMNTMLSHSKR
jgi:hypothetical protein